MFMSHALHIYKSRTIQTHFSLHIAHRQVTHHVYESRTPYLRFTNYSDTFLSPYCTQTSHPPCIWVTHSISTSHELFRHISLSTLQTDKSCEADMIQNLRVTNYSDISLSPHCTCLGLFCHVQWFKTYESRTILIFLFLHIARVLGYVCHVQCKERERYQNSSWLIGFRLCLTSHVTQTWSKTNSHWALVKHRHSLTWIGKKHPTWGKKNASPCQS